jgi:hypothetical protein
MLAMLFALALQLPLQSTTAADVRRLEVSQPRIVIQVTRGDLQGQPARLAWSPDQQELYVRAVRTDTWGNERVWHYIVRLAERSLTPVEGEPPWASTYWLRKSALDSPGIADFRIAIEMREARKTATGSGSGMGQNGGDPNLGAELGLQGQAIIMSSLQAQRVSTTTMRLKGELLGEFVNTPAVPGLTFGWAPAGSGMIAFANTKRRLVLMDASGRKHAVAGVKDVFLPAWSDDGAHVACLQRTARNTYVLAVLDLSVR